MENHYILNSKRDSIYYLFRKLTKVSTNNFKIDINGISDLLEMCKNIILHKSLFINQLEILSHVAKEAFNRYYSNTFHLLDLFSLS